MATTPLGALATRLAQGLAAAVDEAAMVRSACAWGVEATRASAAGAVLQPPLPEAVWVPPEDATVPLLHRLQRDLGEGPALDAQRRRTTVIVQDLRADAPAHWPSLARDTARLGALSLWCTPLVAGRPLGALVFVCARPGAVTSRSLDAGHALAALVAALLAVALRVEAAEEQVRQLTQALESRVMIEQAKGRLAERHGLAPDDAFALLRAHARGHNLRLRQLAAEVAAGTREL